MQEKKRGEDERERWEGVREGGVCEKEGRVCDRGVGDRDGGMSVEEREG